MRTYHTFTAGIAAVALWTAAASGSAQAAGSREDPLQRFHEAVSAYMSLREAVEQTVPPLEMSPDWENIRAAMDAMADALRAARPSAKEGDIFDAATATLLRGRIDETLGPPGCDAESILAAERDDSRLPVPTRPLVHDRFDWGAGSFMPICMFAVLPVLPDELQYRFVERDLVLVDIDADLVIDVLPDALPPIDSWELLRAAAKSFASPVLLARTAVDFLRNEPGTAVAQRGAMTDNLHDRVRGEYREMPGLRLTVAQAARLFNLDPAQCGQLLDTLVTDGALCTNGREYFGPNAGRRSA
jgi:hypothetical protein